MRTLMLNFAKRPRLPLSLAAFVLSGLILALASYREFTLKEEELRAAMQELHTVQQAKKARENVAPTPEALAREKEIAAALQRLTLPWGDFFAAVEAPSNKNVVLLGLKPDVERSQVILTGEAKDLEAVARYVEELQLQKVLRDVHIASHNVQTQSQFRPVRFVVRAEWVLSTK